MEFKNYKLVCVLIVALTIKIKQSSCYFKKMNGKIDGLFYIKKKSTHPPHIFANQDENQNINFMCPKIKTKKEMRV